jgi:glutaminase
MSNRCSQFPIALTTACLFVQIIASLPTPAQVKRSPLAPNRDRIEAVVREAYDKFRSDTSGKNANGIPYLAKVDSNLFSVAVVTTDNQVLELGDVTYSFSIQSISKIFTLALATEELGFDEVLRRIGSQPAGRAFNSVLVVADRPTHTSNAPMNAGGIATTSLIPGKNKDVKWNKILDFYSKVAGERLGLVDEVYKSETDASINNEALSMPLSSHEPMYADPLESAEIYSKQCSVGVNATQLARMGATLANNGKNPATGEQLIKAEDVPYVLSTMSMAELYDSSGSWVSSVGLPTKSGISGGIIAIVPGKGAIAAFAPRLDEAGNSVKAQKVIEYVAAKLNYNLYSPSSAATTASDRLELLSKLDQLVEQNRQLEKQNQELMNEINFLRLFLLKQPGVTANATPKETGVAKPAVGGV